MMSFHTARELKSAGYPQTFLKQGLVDRVPAAEPPVHVPTLEELLGACGRGTLLDFHSEESSTASIPEAGITAQGTTPTEALAKLWIKLNQEPRYV